MRVPAIIVPRFESLLQCSGAMQIRFSGPALRIGAFPPLLPAIAPTQHLPRSVPLIPLPWTKIVASPATCRERDDGRNSTGWSLPA
jgi:hypothetical protein